MKKIVIISLVVIATMFVKSMSYADEESCLIDFETWTQESILHDKGLSLSNRLTFHMIK